MKIAVVGSSGYVGRHMVSLFGQVVKYDIIGEDTNQSEVNACDVAFVCVPTNACPDGSCDTSIVEDVMTWLRVPLVIFRSTVPPGTTERLQQIYSQQQLVMNPEYVGETVSHPMNDTARRSFLILGGTCEGTQQAIRVYQQVYNAEVRLFRCSSRVAEVIKYCENSFIGTYVSFCNEFYDICRAFGVEWEDVREGFLLDPRMTPYWTFVYPKKRGFEGKCIPKDMKAIVYAAKQRGYECPLLNSVILYNSQFQPTELSDNRVDLTTRYIAEEEIRVNRAPYEAYGRCLMKTLYWEVYNSFCDIGCATGHLISFVKKQQPTLNVRGVDLFEYHKHSEHCDQQIRDNIDILDIRDPLPENFPMFDVVNCSELAEHIDPAFADVLLCNLKRITRHRLVMTWSSHGGEHDREHDGHLQHLNPLTLDDYKELMREHGFKEVLTETVRFHELCDKEPHFAGWWKESLIIWEKDEPIQHTPGVNQFYIIPGTQHWVHSGQLLLMNRPNDVAFHKKMLQFQQLLIELVDEKRSATFIHHGDGDYYFLNQQSVGSAAVGKRALSVPYEHIDIQRFKEGFLKNTYICLEEFEPKNRKLYQQHITVPPHFPTEFLYGLVMNKWFLHMFRGRIGLIGAGPKLDLIEQLMRHQAYQHYLGIDKFIDYIRIPQQFACDNVDHTLNTISTQLKHAKADVFLVGIGHVKSAVLHELPNMKSGVYLDVGSGIDALAGVIDRERPYAYGWKNHRLRDFDYSRLDLLQYTCDGSEVLL